jgi:hypothetical protein
VVIGATIEGSDQVDQPKWIAITSSNQSRRNYHVPADAIVSPLEPGRYRYFHIDFHEHYTVNRGARSIRLSKWFRVAAGAVTIFGMIKVPADLDYRKIEFAINDELIALACAKNLEVMEGFPVFVVRWEEEQPVRIKCPIAQ